MKAERRAILDWLSATDYSDQQADYASARETGTCQWLLDHETFKMFVAIKGSTLFCPGIPGAGKTMASCAIIQHLHSTICNNDGSAVCYIYLDYKEQRLHKLNNFLATILYQLIWKLEKLPASLHALYEKHNPQRSRPSTDEYVKTIEQVIYGLQRAFLILDALDECSDREGANIQLLDQVFKLQRSTGIQIFATSRHIPEIEVHFKSALHIEIRAKNEDVARYLDTRINYLPRCIQNSVSLQEQVCQTILDSIDGMRVIWHQNE